MGRRFLLFSSIQTKKVKTKKSRILRKPYEKHLLKAILTYFKCEDRKISFTLNNEGVTHYKIHLSGKDFRSLLAYHFNSYPLLGNRHREYMAWMLEHHDEGKGSPGNNPIEE